ncbi:HAD-IA family hydrolase [Stenotrophomonas acidaminiphila]|uniref:HAD-IA family hydrolase n=1 Tax=Stenotrophomonas acidaminiphila TaxID=128780 RepID=UPI0024AE2000|nr:HAD-IA family hydrolase [Stenotrophomonas acidaminiphila]WHL18202.1 HAD-IA family hydrolase [Stenotrophomonas acidaminiphila]
MIPMIHALLLDFDGLLADYDHPRHLRHLAQAAGCTPAVIDAQLRGAGLELAHARGELDGDALLRALNTRLGTGLAAADWLAARTRASTLRRDTLALLQRLRPDVRVAVLTNNGALSAAAIAALLPGIEVLCSATLGVRKPDPRIYLAAAERLGSAPARTLFIDHLFRNVQGARSAGLHADTAHHTQSLRRVLRRWHLL